MNQRGRRLLMRNVAYNPYSDHYGATSGTYASSMGYQYTHTGSYEAPVRHGPTAQERDMRNYQPVIDADAMFRAQQQQQQLAALAAEQGRQAAAARAELHELKLQVAKKAKEQQMVEQQQAAIKACEPWKSPLFKTERPKWRFDWPWNRMR